MKVLMVLTTSIFQNLHFKNNKMGLSEREKGMLAHARRTKQWYDRNRWVRFPMIIGVMVLGWYTPTLAFILALGLGIYFLAMWNIINKA